jgi:hypothetical protein
MAPRIAWETPADLAAGVKGVSKEGIDSPVKPTNRRFVLSSSPVLISAD